MSDKKYTEDELLKIVQEDTTEVNIQWTDFDDFIYEKGVFKGDRLTHMFALVYMFDEWRKDKDVVKDNYGLVKKWILERFDVEKNGRTKTTSMEAWELWKKEEKTIRRRVRRLKKEATKHLRQKRRDEETTQKPD